MSDLYTVAQVAKKLQVSEYRVRELVKSGKAEHIRTQPDGVRGGLIRFTEDQYKGLLTLLTVPAQATERKRRPSRRRAHE